MIVQVRRDSDFGELAEAVEVQPPFGRCRRRCPTMNGYPAVFGDDWCGDHKLDEGKA